MPFLFNSEYENMRQFLFGGYLVFLNLAPALFWCHYTSCRMPNDSKEASITHSELKWLCNVFLAMKCYYLDSIPFVRLPEI